MRALFPIVVATALLASSAPAQEPAQPLQADLQRARAEQARAEAEAAKLQESAARARGEAARLQAQQAAAAQAIDAAEARITTAGEQLRLASAYVVAQRARLLEQQQPVSSLLAGLALMARRPPLLAIADHQSVDELVEVRILLDSTLPVIRRRTEGLSAELAQGERLKRQAQLAQAELVSSRRNLSAKRQQFAELEQKALESALAKGGEALGVGDVAIAAGEDVQRLESSESSRQSALAMARQLAGEDAAPVRPSPEEGPAAFSLRYQLPAKAPVTEGLAEISESGVRSRGVALATPPGLAITAPADGVVRFSGPFRDYNGVLIIDHGSGWTSLIVNVSSPLTVGAKVHLGDPVGRALGPLSVELSHNGSRISPALIAGSSQTLSKAMKGG